MEEDNQLTDAHSEMLIELIEVILLDRLVGNLEAYSQLPWYELIAVAYRKNIVIHTDIPDYFLTIYFFYITLGQLYDSTSIENDTAKQHYKYNAVMNEFYLEIYKACRDVYNKNENPVGPWLLWLDVTLSLYLKLLKETDYFYERGLDIGPLNEARHQHQIRMAKRNYKNLQDFLKTMNKHLDQGDEEVPEGEVKMDGGAEFYRECAKAMETRIGLPCTSGPIYQAYFMATARQGRTFY